MISGHRSCSSGPHKTAHCDFDAWTASWGGHYFPTANFRLGSWHDGARTPLKTNPIAMKPIIYLTSALILIATAEAKKQSETKGNNERARQERTEKQEKKDARNNKREAVNKVLDAKDKNNDGSLTQDEYLAGEVDVESSTQQFKDANKNGDRYLSRGEIAEMLGV